MTIEEFLKLYIKYLNEEFNSEENKIDENDFMSEYKEDGLYGIGYTTLEESNQELELIYDFNNQKLIWKTNGRKVHEKNILINEIYSIFDFNLVYEYSDD